MTDPKRLLEEGSALEASLLGSAMEDAPRRGLDRKIQAALGMSAVAISTGTASTTAAAAAASKAAPVLVSVGIAKWAGIVAIGAGAIVGAATLVHREPAAPPAPRVVPAAAAEPRAEASPIPAPPVESPVALPTPVAVAPPVVVNRSVETRAPVVQEAAREEARPQPPPLSSELTLMDEANAAIDSGDANRAMTLLDRHDLEFLHGRLAPEALELRIRAYALRHDDAKVAELGRAFLSRYPESPLVPRVRALLVSSDRP